MKTKVQSKAIESDQGAKRDNATLIFGLAISVIFIGMLILNAIS